jgi:hypothetical protein
MANVTGTEFEFRNKKSSYAFIGKSLFSQIYEDEEKDKYGYSYFLELAKISGNFRFELSRLVESDKYDPNDFGFLYSNNEITNQLELNYNIYKPVWEVLNWKNELEFTQTDLYHNKKFSLFRIDFSSETMFKNYLYARIHAQLKPFEEHNYFEARVDNRKFVKPRMFHICGGMSTDYKKPYALDLFGGITKSYSYSHNQDFYWFEVGNRYRISDKLLITYTLFYGENNNDIGYVDRTDDDAIIYFGKREKTTITNTFTTNYIFNNKSALNFRLRHYWSRAEYMEFYELQDDGDLKSTDYVGSHDINYNAFNIDLVYTWRFAPGSELSVIWKTAIDEEEDIVRTNSFSGNFENTLDLPTTSSLSVKLLYYLDWQRLRKLRVRS